MNNNSYEIAVLENHQPPSPAGQYQAWVINHGLLFVSGQTSKESGAIKYRGKVGRDLSLEEGREAAKLCAINLLAQLNEAVGNKLERIERCLKLTVFINCADDFDLLPKVADAASELLLEVLGEKGWHTRSAIGAANLPGGSSVEIDGLFAVSQ